MNTVLILKQEVKQLIERLGVDISPTDYSAIIDFLVKKFGVLVRTDLYLHRDNGPWSYSVIDCKLNCAVDEEMRAWPSHIEALLNGITEGIAYVLTQVDSGIVIAIDGYPASGKSTMARRLAKEIGYTYIDSGAMYRSVALYYMQHPELEINPSTLENIRISFRYSDKNQITQLNGVDVEDKIRELEVGNLASDLGVVDCVKDYIGKLQRQIGSIGGVVMDGRDIGTVVFPNAQLKIFVTADKKIRAERRLKELQSTKELSEVLDDLNKRDYQDINQFTGANSRKASDAFYLDTSLLSEDEQFEYIKRLFMRAIKSYWLNKPDIDLSSLKTNELS